MAQTVNTDNLVYHLRSIISIFKEKGYEYPIVIQGFIKPLGESVTNTVIPVYQGEGMRFENPSREDIDTKLSNDIRRMLSELAGKDLRYNLTDFLVERGTEGYVQEIEFAVGLKEATTETHQINWNNNGEYFIKYRNADEFVDELEEAAKAR